MFDGCTVDNTRYTTNIKVEQAGLHDAVKNYKEFRDDAEKAAAKLEIAKFGASNEVRYLKSHTERNFETNGVRTVLVYEVNGEVYRLEKVLEEQRIGDRRDPRVYVAESIAHAIVKQLLEGRKLCDER